MLCAGPPVSLTSSCQSLLYSQEKKSRIEPCSFSCTLSSPEPDNCKIIFYITLFCFSLLNPETYTLCKLLRPWQPAPHKRLPSSRNRPRLPLILVNICINGTQSSLSIFFILSSTCYKVLSIKVTNSELWRMKLPPPPPY